MDRSIGLWTVRSYGINTAKFTSQNIKGIRTFGLVMLSKGSSR